METVILPRVRDLGGFSVRRALPAGRKKQMVGPFIFFDQMGPAVFTGEDALDVRPHPHIGLSTVTWLIEGQITHKDSLGSDLVIRPGELNLMTAGSGIAHSERSPQEDRQDGKDHPMLGLQAWLALPKQHEERDPAFAHYGIDDMPYHEGDGVAMTLIAGSAFGMSSPMTTYCDTLYAEIRQQGGSRFNIPRQTEERAVYILSGEIRIAGEAFEAGALVCLREGVDVVIETTAKPAHYMLLGGEAADGPRHIWWNFVHSDPERIEQAKRDWVDGRFASVPGDDKEFIPLPDGP
ncbi:MAG: pirin family protein [Alphaproteobacteria bacterium]